MEVWMSDEGFEHTIILVLVLEKLVLLRWWVGWRGPHGGLISLGGGGLGKILQHLSKARSHGCQLREPALAYRLARGTRRGALCDGRCVHAEQKIERLAHARTILYHRVDDHHIYPRKLQMQNITFCLSYTYRETYLSVQEVPGELCIGKL